MAKTGMCEHCGVGVQFVDHDPDDQHMLRSGSKVSEKSSAAALDALGYKLITMHCPVCSKPSIYLWHRGDEHSAFLIYPSARRVREPPKEVENKEVRRDYGEATATMQTSPRGAAALARRALQGALREKGFTHPSKKLSQEITVAAESTRMPSELVEKLNFLKDVGNDGAHPNYDHAGEIMDVTPDEFRVLIETLNEFFDVFYVRPARHKAVMDANKARKKGTPEDKEPK